MILELCKGVHCVDLDKSFQTHIYLQNLASIQPRTSPLKFAASAGGECGRGSAVLSGGCSLRDGSGKKQDAGVHVRAICEAKSYGREALPPLGCKLGVLLESSLLPYIVSRVYKDPGSQQAYTFFQANIFTFAGDLSGEKSCSQQNCTNLQT